MYPTRELERERAARVRRHEKRMTEAVPKSTNQKPGSSARHPKQLNLKTYKFHALGDYVQTIRRFGTTDSYSTQPVGSLGIVFDALTHEMHQSEREHRTLKARFLRTSGCSIPKQLSAIERRQRSIRTIRQNLDGFPSQVEPKPAVAVANVSAVQYDVGESEKSSVHIPTFLQRNEGDLAIKVSNFLSSTEVR